MTKKIIFPGPDKDITGQYVNDYIERAIYVNSNGELDEALRNGSSAQEALGRLCQVLADKDLLSVKDLLFIAGDTRTDRIAEFRDV